jgi:PIN domain nuclease of toxin-antitoxin system
MIEATGEEIFLSVVSLWEMAIKVSLGKLKMPSPFLDFVEHQITENSFSLLVIKPVHIERIVSLPFHHRDPFDRMLVSQSLSETLPIIGKDEIFDLYGVSRYW